MLGQPKIWFARYRSRILCIGGLALAYIILVLGYHLAVQPDSYSSTLHILCFTGLQIGYAIALWWLFQSHVPLMQEMVSVERQLAFKLGLLTVLTLVCGWLCSGKMHLDWPLYLLTITIYCGWLPFRMSLLLSLLLYALMGINLLFAFNGDGRQALAVWFSLLFVFLVVVALMWLLRLLNMQKKRAESLAGRLAQSSHELEQAQQQLREYMQRGEELARMQERERLAREIYDDLGRSLSTLNSQLAMVAKVHERSPRRTAAELADARQMAAQTLQEVRSAVAMLHPESIVTLRLTEAFMQLGRDFEHANDRISLTLDLNIQLPPLSPELQIALYRAAQEALTNVRRYAKASEVLLRLRCEDEMLEMAVHDNSPVTGIAEQRTTHLDLLNLRERFALLGAR
ncbi:sensor histidine kinase [Ktedonosporobacter rubrisoli]|nr:histidine kinase [Ktedonosporobacter rubrisoli]